MKNRTIRHPLALFALAALGAGCSGGGSSHASYVPPTKTTASQAHVKLSIKIPSRTASAPARAAKYVSPATQRIEVTVTPSGAPPNPQIINIPNNPNCSSAGGAIQCNAQIDAPVGSDTFAIATYDAANSGGNLLSRGSIAWNIVAGQDNPVALSLNGIVASIALAFDPSAPVYEGVKQSGVTATVQAQDASQNTIVGTFDSPVTVTASANSSISVTAGTLNSSSDKVTFDYNGDDPASGSFVATVGGAQVGTIAFAPFNPKNASLASAKLAAWYDAADSSTVTATGGAVTTWADRSGKSLNVAQSAANAQPTYPGAATLGGHNVIDFKPGQSLFATTGFPSSSYSIFYVASNVKADSGNGNGNLLSGGMGTQPSVGHALYVSDNSTLCIYDGSAGCSAATITSPTLFASPVVAEAIVDFSQQQNNATLIVNGVKGQLGTLTAPATPDASIVINGFNNDVTTPPNANSGTASVAEAIVFDGALSDADRTQIEGYLKAKWGVSF